MTAKAATSSRLTGPSLPRNALRRLASWLALLLLVFNILAGNLLAANPPIPAGDQASVLLAQAMEICSDHGSDGPSGLPDSHADHEKRCLCCLPAMVGSAALPVAELRVERPVLPAQPGLPESELGSKAPTRLLVSAPPRAPPFA